MISTRKKMMRERGREAQFCVVTRNELMDARLTYSVIGAFVDVYNALGYGFYESTYAKALEHELKERKHTVMREVTFQVIYKAEVVGVQRVDMIVDNRLLVETKATQELQKGAGRQIYSYLHASKLSNGLLLHFGPLPKFYRFLNRDAFGNPKNP